MKKTTKFTMMGTGALIGSILLISSVYAGAVQPAGYTAYKEAIKKTHQVESVTGSMNLTLLDNGKQVAAFDTDGKFNLTTETASGSLAVTDSDGTKVEVSAFHSPEQSVIYNPVSGVYNVVNHTDSDAEYESEHHRWSEHEGHGKAGEAIIDALVGDLKQYFAMEEAGNGSKSISMELTGSQIPTLVNTIGSLMITEHDEHRDEAKHDAALEHELDEIGLDLPVEQLRSLKHHFPELESDVRIAEIALEAEVNADNLITEQIFHITVTGKDADGNAHELVVRLDADLSAHNSTTPDSVDLTGKTVRTVDEAKLKEHHDRYDR